MITGYIEREAVAVAELKDGMLVPVGLVKFGLVGKGLWPRLERRRAGPASRAGIIPVRPELVAAVRHFGRYRTGWIRDGRGRLNMSDTAPQAITQVIAARLNLRQTRLLVPHL